MFHVQNRGLNQYMPVPRHNLFPAALGPNAALSTTQETQALLLAMQQQEQLEQSLLQQQQHHHRHYYQQQQQQQHSYPFHNDLQQLLLQQTAHSIHVLGSNLPPQALQPRSAQLVTTSGLPDVSGAMFLAGQRMYDLSQATPLQQGNMGGFSYFPVQNRMQAHRIGLPSLSLQQISSGTSDQTDTFLLQNASGRPGVMMCQGDLIQRCKSILYLMFTPCYS